MIGLEAQLEAFDSLLKQMAKEIRDNNPQNIYKQGTDKVVLDRFKLSFKHSSSTVNLRTKNNRFAIETTTFC